MRPLLFLALGTAGLAWAQFTGLTATEDGSSFYFSSQFRLRGASQSFDGKIFRLDSTGPALFEQRDHGQQVANTFAEFYSLVAPQVASNGSVIAFTGTRPCYGGSGCIGVQTAQGTVTDSAGNEILRALGYVNLSPNGQWAVFSARNTFGNFLSPAELVDLSTGVHVDVPFSFGTGARRRIADDGTIAFFNNGSILLWRTDGQQTIADPGLISSTPSTDPPLMISNDAQRLVYQSSNGLVRYDRPQAIRTTITSSPAASVQISDDASTIAWVNALDSQIWVASPLGRQLAAIPEGVSEVALSGDGSVLFATTKTERIIRIDVASGAITELIPRTPSITASPYAGISGRVASGSIVVLTGLGLSELNESAPPPLAGALGDVRIVIGDSDVPVAAISPDVVWFQLPWELPPQDYKFEFLSGSSPFETGPDTITVQAVAPEFFETMNGDGGFAVKAVHGDWSALVNSDNPAHPGETIYLYMAGLGPVNPPVPTGSASPDTPPSQITGALSCQFLDGLIHDATIFFAGLAPGMVGIYQVSLQIPMDLRGPGYAIGIICGFGSESSAFGNIYVTYSAAPRTPPTSKPSPVKTLLVASSHPVER